MLQTVLAQQHATPPFSQGGGGGGGAPGEGTAASSLSEHEVTARHIMEIADGHARNGMISGSELVTFLSRHEEYKEFVEWLFRPRDDGQPGLGGKRATRFQEFDTDDTGSLEIGELEEAVGLWLAEAGDHPDYAARIQQRRLSNWELEQSRVRAEQEAREARVRRVLFRALCSTMQHRRSLFGVAQVREQFGRYKIRDPRKVFAAMDLDGNGTLSAEEFAHAIGSLKAGFSEYHCMQLLKVVDRNDDGRVDEAEFQWLCAQISESRRDAMRAFNEEECVPVPSPVTRAGTGVTGYTPSGTGSGYPTPLPGGSGSATPTAGGAYDAAPRSEGGSRFAQLPPGAGGGPPPPHQYGVQPQGQHQQRAPRSQPQMPSQGGRPARSARRAPRRRVAPEPSLEERISAAVDSWIQSNEAPSVPSVVLGSDDEGDGAASPRRGGKGRYAHYTGFKSHAKHRKLFASKRLPAQAPAEVKPRRPGEGSHRRRGVDRFTSGSSRRRK